MKKTVKILALTLAAGMVCGIAACSGSSSKISLDSYWYRDSYEGIQNSAINGASEVLCYDISFESGDNGKYRVEYDDGGYYRTELTTARFDWSKDTIDDYKSDESDTDTTETVYVLTTIMEVSGKYIYGSSGTEATDANSVAFSDYVVTVTCFRSARNTLSPIYSRQSVRSTSPNGMSPTSATKMCATVQYEYEVFYNKDASKATYTYTAYDPETSSYKNGDISSAINDNKTISEIFKTLSEKATVVEDECFEKTVSGLNGKYTLFDNNSLYMAVRGMSLSSSFSAVVSLFIPAQGGTYNVSITGGNEDTLDTDNNETDKTIYNALTTAYGTPETDDGVINYNTVSITSNTSLSGTLQTAWYAAVEDEDDNQYRATLLYLEVPLSYSLGTLKYTLKEVKSVLGATASTTTSE